MKKITIHRTSDKKGANGYTPISNKIIQCENMTLEESGLLSYLLSLPIDFTVVQKNILKKLKGRISAGGFRTAWKGLVNKGHIVEAIYYKNNLRRVGWEVFEDVEDRESGNRELREPSLLKSKQEESKEVKSNNIESNTSIINTGTSVLEQKVERKSDLSFFFEEAKMEAIQFLTGATILGEEILLYSSPEKHDDLVKCIGNIKFDLVADQLDKFNYANQQLNKLKSSSTQGLIEEEPT